jgi:hypothetical protein
MELFNIFNVGTLLATHRAQANQQGSIMKTRQILAVLVTGTLLSANVSAHAAELSLTDRVIAGVGNVIAAEGNNALRSIRNELKRNLVNTLKPLLPEPSPNNSEASATTDNDANLQDYVNLHEQTRAVQ